MTIMAQTTEQAAGAATLWPTVWIALFTGTAAVASSVLSQWVTARSASRAARDTRDHEIELKAAQDRQDALNHRNSSYLKFIESVSELLLEMGKTESVSSGKIRSLAHGALMAAISVQLHGSEAANNQAARMIQSLGYAAHGTPLWLDHGTSVDRGADSLSTDLAEFLNITRSEQSIV
jgi:hypothetical protein